MSDLVIAARYCGPAGSGNGGYTCGVLARQIKGDAEVTLRRPPPLDVPLDIRFVADGADLWDGDHLVAEGRSHTFDFEVPEPPTMEQAIGARGRYRGYQSHAFPDCFVCGTDRDDGMSIHAGKVEGRDLWASPFTPEGSLPAADGILESEMVWSALDCPGAWAVERATQNQPVVLGRMAAHLERDAPADGEYVVVGWPLGGEGRKLFSGTALFDTGGNLHGQAFQTWIVLTSGS